VSLRPANICGREAILFITTNILTYYYNISKKIIQKRNNIRFIDAILADVIIKREVV